jgi:hypothetical protein
MKMNIRNALKLHNRDEVQVRVDSGQWESAYVLGDPYRKGTVVMVPVQSKSLGFKEVPHTDIR